MCQVGDKLDSVVTAKFSKCGTLNGKTIDMKVVCSDIVIKGTEDWQLSWTAYGTTDMMANVNEWWYYNTEHVKVNVYFYYTGSDIPITFNNAYLSIYSEDENEGCTSQTATDRYIYEKTDMIYTPTWKSNVNSTIYQNVFYGGTNKSGRSISDGTLRCVSFRYQNVNNIEVELLTLNPDINSGAGYHLEYISLTATKPNNPKKVVDKTVVNSGDTITYTITQNISKATDQNFYYDSLVFGDQLNANVTEQTLKVYNETNQDVTSTAGTSSYDSTTHTLNYNFDKNYLKTMSYKGQTYRFVIKAKVKNHVTSGNITNTAFTIINDKYTLTSNTVTSKIPYKVIVNHVDEKGNKLANMETINGYEGEPYTTISKKIQGYELIETPQNWTEKMNENVTTVTYCYKLKDTSVISKYIDEKGQEITDSEIIKGKVFDQYNTKSKEIYGYDLIKEPQNATGKMTEEQITVNYVYRLKDTSVIAKYIDEEGKEIENRETIEGKVFDEYTTKPKEIYGYNLIEDPQNVTGKMTEEQITVDYVYRLKDANVIAEYKDEKGTEIADSQMIRGKVFDQYSTEEKEICGYKLVKVPENNTGMMKEDSINVTYQYRKLKFNIAVSQKLTGILLNDEQKDISRKLEIDRRMNLDSLKLTYRITVSNDSELDGSTILYNEIPNGYVALEKDNSDWKIEDKVAYRNVDNLVIGETREFSIVLTATSDEIAGTVINRVSCKNSTCEPKFEELTLEDNTDIVELIISISTGLTEHLTEIIIIIGILVLLTILIIILFRIKKTKNYKKRRNAEFQ